MSAIFDAYIDRDSLGLTPLTLHGTTQQAGWNLMPDWQLPGLDPETVTAGSNWLHGTPATSFTWRDGVFSGSVFPVADDAADLADLVAQMRAALGRLSFPLVTVWGSVSQTWTARPGGLVPSPVRAYHVKLDRPVYSLTIPCHPIPGA